MILSRLFQMMAERQASDLFVSAGTPIQMKVNNQVHPIGSTSMTPNGCREMAYELLTEAQVGKFELEHELNFSHQEPDLGNFRVNLLFQRGTVGMVIRYIRDTVPDFSTLHLPPALLEMIMSRRGLILIVGSVGSGKSTTLAAMLDYRNQRQGGHILTIEDPIEYIMQHKRSVVNQREIGSDSFGYEAALTNALRQAPDVLMIGEIRERSTMHHALTHALTGNLCISTLHATNAYHALSRIINMYPLESRSGLLADLAYGLRAIVAQRLVRNRDGRLTPAVEVLMNTQLIAEHITNGNLQKIKEAMEQSLTAGSQTFEQVLAKMVVEGEVDVKEAMAASDSPTNLQWLISHSKNTANSVNALAAEKASSFSGFGIGDSN